MTAWLNRAAIPALLAVLVACQSTPKSDTPRQQATDLLHQAEDSSTIVLIVIALIVAWMILLGFVGRMTRTRG